MSSYLKKHWRGILNLITIAAMGLLIYAIRDELVGVLGNLKNINYWVLLLIIPLQLLDYDAYARMYRNMLNHLGQPVRYRSMYRVSLELNFVNNTFPSGGAAGISFFGLRLKQYGVKGGTATLVQLLKFFMIFISFQVLTAVGLLALAIGDKTNNILLLMAGFLGGLTIVGTLLAIYIISSPKRIDGFFTFITKILNRLIRLVRWRSAETINIAALKAGVSDMHDAYVKIKADPGLVKSSLGYALLANICEVLTIYVVYLAFGEVVNIGAVIIAFAIANFAGLVSVLPGGIGVYEALMTAALVAGGVPAALSIPVIITYRVLRVIVQILPGYILYTRALGGGRSG